jgi:uncharacterized protein (DUF4415 family)
VPRCCSNDRIADCVNRTPAFCMRKVRPVNTSLTIFGYSVFRRPLWDWRQQDFQNLQADTALTVKAKPFRSIMISDEPDEDADLLDDEAALDAYLGQAGPQANGGSPASPSVPDWPPRGVCDVALTLDTETLAWFKATNADWRGEIRSILRAWIAAKAARRQ